MSNDYLSTHLKDAEQAQRFEQDRLLVEVASAIYKAMRERGVSRKQLADALGVTKARVTHYLSGQSNLTLRTVADIFGALECRVRPQVESRQPLASGWEEIPGMGSKFRLPESWFPPNMGVDSHDESKSCFDLAS